MKKIITIIGARPQFVKTPLISGELRKFAHEIIVHTGQHYDANMSEVFFKELNIPKPDYNLAVGSSAQGKQTGEMLQKIEEILIKEKPDLVLIYGDTNSTIAGALAAVKLHIPVAHVEAGMRSYNRQMPEEINRVVSDHISALLFTPTKSSAKILKEEGITKGVYFVGDVMADIQTKLSDATVGVRHLSSDKNHPPAGGSKIKIMETLSIEPKKYILATVHRQENTDNKKNLENIVKAFLEIKEPIVFAIHPRTKKFLKEYGLEKLIAKSENIKLTDPVGFLDMIALEQNARLILTDSGGVQKEAYLNKVPCVTLRKETEWIETVKSGWNRLCGTDVAKTVRLVKKFPKPKNHPNFLGNGKAYLKIANLIRQYLTQEK